MSPSADFPHDAVVIRGGESKPEDIELNAHQHWLESGKREYAVSVFAHRFRSAEWIALRAARAGRLPHPIIKQTTVRELKAAGYGIRKDGKHGHALIPLSNPPSSSDWPTISALFSEERPNPGLRIRR